jgi:hypothetical protein
MAVAEDCSFILEGIATVLIAFSAFFVLHDFPDTASFLTIEERAYVVHKLKYQGSKGSGQMVAETEGFHWKDVKAALTDWQILVALWVCLPSLPPRERTLTWIFQMYWGIVCPLYGISLFLPTIINELGFVTSTAQLLTVPIYITAAILTVVIAYFSDRSKVGRAPYIFIPMCAILIGFIIAIAGSAHGGLPGLVYAGVFIATCGIYPAFPGNITWISNNLAGSYKRSAGMAFHIGAGNLAGAMASNFYREADKPKYLLGHGLEIGFVSVGLVAVVILRTTYQKINERREREGMERGFSNKEMSEMGDRAPTFRYML